MDERQLSRVRFGAFELDLKSGELFSTSTNAPKIRIVLARQPFHLLLMMIEREGAMVTREEIQQRFWPNDTIVEFDHSINVAIGKLRKALGDSAEKPQYIATVASRGYRLLTAVEWIAAAENSPGEQPLHRADGVVTIERSAATIQAGQTVSHYRVLDIIGGGGMGVVYRAEDLKLGRRVAIKFLPGETVADSRARRRFEREAQTASSLNHPNICTIYEFGEHDGQPFLVMELLQGQNLRDWLAAAQGEKGLPLDSLLNVAIQISSGLQAAHERGIIHRDIKPANIFLTDKGACKILDFGLAKLLENSEPDAKTQDPSRLPQHTLPSIDLSRIGLAMGTAGYMSPEQVRGEKLDPRTDLFSFGLVLYEMATGQRAFSGETPEKVHDAILRLTPVSIRDLNSGIPPGLEKIIDAAMEKNRERRIQSASEMRAEFLQLERDGDSGRSAPKQEIRSDPEMIVGLIKRNKRAFVALTVVACVIAAVVLGRIWRIEQHSPKPTETALTQNSFGAPVLDAAISPNGNLLAYTDTSGINLKVISSGEVHTLFTPAAARIVRIAWFPDSSNLIFTSVSPQSSQHQVWAGSIFGGAPRLLRSDADDASISADGSDVLFTNGAKDEIWEMDAAGGNARKLVSRGGFYFYHPVWYAGGHRILYIVTPSLTGDLIVEHASLESLDLETGQSSTVRENCSEFGLLPDGRLIFSSDSLLWKVPINAQTALPTGQPLQVAGVNVALGLHPTVSTDGKRLVILKADRDPANGFGAVVFVADLEDKGVRMTNARRLTVRGNAYAHDWTPDSQAVVFESERNRRYGIYKQSLDRSVAEPLVAGNENSAVGRFSPDGLWILYVAGNSANENRLMRMPASGGPSEEILDGRDMRNYYCTNSAANLCVIGKQESGQLVFYAFDPSQKLPAGGLSWGDLRELARTDYNPSDWSLAPDGTSIAMVRPSNGKGSIHVISLQHPEHEASVRTAATHDVVVEGWTYLFDLNWAADGKGWYIGTRADPAGSTFLYVDLKGHATVLQSDEGVEPSWAVPSPDGRHLAFSKTTFTNNAWLLENF